MPSLLHKPLRSEQRSWRKYLLRAVFVLSWSLYEWVRTTAAGDDGEGVLPATSSPVLVDAFKFVISTVFYLWYRRSFAFAKQDSGKPRADSEYGEDAVPLNGFNEDGRSGDSEAAVQGSRPESRSDIRVPPSLAIVLTLLASVLFTYHVHIETLVERLTGTLVLYLTSSAATLCIVLAAYATSFALVTPLAWQSALTQFSGFWIVNSSLMMAPSIMPSLYPLLVGVTFSTAFAYALMEFIYTRVHSISLGMLLMLLFASACLIDLVSPSKPSLPVGTALLSWMSLVYSACRAVVDLMILTSIYLEGAVTTGVLLSASAAIYLLSFSLCAHAFTGGLLLGSCIVLVGAFTFFNYNLPEERSLKASGWVSRLVVAVLACATTIYLALATHGAIRDISSSAPPRGPSLLDKIAASKVTCRRRPLASYWPHKRTYHAFDNVLLIVFFSHARYDVNLDYYQEVYSEFFPNIVFIGPGNREDHGFRHSYDVMVDTYEADEDLSDPSFYKMAGRMAHHMLYTAMHEHDCYDGYLWAPFDTLLNVPRLQKFDQNLVWYHSPFAQYVFNPALGDGAANQNVSRHAPPAKISPDPALNLTATWRHWGPDWWWGEPHVGVDVCMPAFKKVAPAMRAHLATLTNGTRFMGGSADTLYVPGRLRGAFLDVLGLFLETDCFLEIATPTALHLVAPPGDPILYVDHWWIWQPPFDASFVRQQWARGLEVDTFHTFHWGDRGEDGVWRGEPRHVEDVRKLLKESAVRQGLEWPYWTST